MRCDTGPKALVKKAVLCCVLQVLILDWDVHHGNGTEDVFYGSDQVLYISTHQQGLWPYTGAGSSEGKKPGM
jgi:acetoin utilization deacetylase AcuC-like enzyme